jgi:L-amino acid N-acyltransferase YncA
MPGAVEILDAMPADAAAMADLYAHHVLHGTATFETEPPDAGEMAVRLARVLAQGAPWLVARGETGEVLGYAYASQFRERAAYRYACENSIYLRHDRLGQGVGTALLAQLLVAAEQSGFRQMIAVIAGTGEASVALHARAGFTQCGKLVAAGRKHAQWIDVIYMQRALGEGATTPPAEEP